MKQALCLTFMRCLVIYGSKHFTVNKATHTYTKQYPVSILLVLIYRHPAVQFNKLCAREHLILCTQTSVLLLLAKVNYINFMGMSFVIYRSSLIFTLRLRLITHNSKFLVHRSVRGFGKGSNVLKESNTVNKRLYNILNFSNHHNYCLKLYKHIFFILKLPKSQLKF